MNPQAVGEYIDLLSKFIKLSSVAFPLFAILLRRFGLVAPVTNKPPDPFATALGVLGFGCLGSIIGLCLTVLFCVGAIVFFGFKFFAAQTGTEPVFGSIDWGIFRELVSKTNLIFVASGILSTLLTFGGKDQPKGLGFLAGAALGTTFAVLFLLSIFVH